MQDLISAAIKELYGIFLKQNKFTTINRTEMHNQKANVLQVVK